MGIGAINGSFNLNVEEAMCASSYNSTSDKRLKKDISPIIGALDKIKNINGVRYQWRHDEFKDRQFKKGYDLGVIAQDIEDVVPEAVLHQEDGYYSVSYQTLIPVLIEGVKEQQQYIETQQEKLDAQKQGLEILKVKSDRHDKELQELRSMMQEFQAKLK